MVFTFTFFSVPIASAAGSFEDGFNAGLAACPTCEKTSCPTHNVLHVKKYHVQLSHVQIILKVMWVKLQNYV